jgi:hypothetical protein
MSYAHVLVTHGSDYVPSAALGPLGRRMLQVGFATDGQMRSLKQLGSGAFEFFAPRTEAW